jgi:hypothetical protein
MADTDELGVAEEGELRLEKKPDTLRRLLSTLFVVASLAAAAYFVWRYRDELGQALAVWSARQIAAASGLALLALLANFMVWREVLRGLGVNFGLREGAGVFFVSQLGKYLPGAMWPIVAQLEFARRTRVGRTRVLAANLYSLAIGLTIGLVVAISTLLVNGGAALQRFWWALLLVPILCALIHPRTLPGLVDWILRRAGRSPLGLELAWATIIRAAIWSLVSWLLFGLHLYSLIAALGAPGVSAAGLAMGAFALGTVLGILFVPAPAGAGVRDVIMILTLGAIVSAPLALAAGLLSRAILTVADVALAGAFGLGGGSSRRLTPGHALSDQRWLPRK